MHTINTNVLLTTLFIMWKPYANAPILYIWRNGKRYGNAIFSRKAALKKCEDIATDIFADNSEQIEILNEETGEITMYRKGVKHK